MCANIITPANKAETGSVVITSNGTLFDSNPSRRYWFIQNVGTVPIFVKFGAGASATSFNAIIHGGTSDSDGTGGTASSDNPISYTGDISVYSTNLKVVAYEL